MEKSRKRKQLHSNKPDQTKPSKTINEDPYPTHPRPTPDECLAIRDELLALHGFPQEFAKYRKQRLILPPPKDEEEMSSLIMSTGGAHSDALKSEPLKHEEESVLDGLIKTVLSQNTTEVNSLRAFASLKAAFPAWEPVLAAESKCIENAIRCGGLAPTKAACIKNILSCLLEKRGKLCLEYLRDLSVDEIKAELSHFKGIGPKTLTDDMLLRELNLLMLSTPSFWDTMDIIYYKDITKYMTGFGQAIKVACVLMFHLQQDDFPVDTHVFEIAKAIGWVPSVADRNKTYLHLNQRIAKELKFDLNCLLYTHGKLCRKCTKKGGNQQRKESHDDSCPLLNFCKNSNMNKTSEEN